VNAQKSQLFADEGPIYWLHLQHLIIFE